ncbi:MAG: DUF819 family protein [Flavobacteriaceae bacterium]|jgi:uncharacterized membrane protein
MNTLLLSLSIVSVTLVVVYLLEKQENKWIKGFLQWVPPILFAYIVPALICALFDLDLAQGAIHQWSKQWIIPIAILSIMGSLSLRALRIVGIRPLLLFVLGSFCIALLPVVLVAVGNFISADFQQTFSAKKLWTGLVPIVGSWIGGSTSQLVLKEYVGTSEELFLSVLVLDNVLVNIWTLLMFQLIKKSAWLNQKFGLPEAPVLTSTEHEDKSTTNTWATLGLLSLGIALPYMLKLSFLQTIVGLSFLGIIYGNRLRFWNHALCLKLGSFSIVLVMAILGLKLNFSQFELPLIFVLLVLAWLILQFVLSFFTALLLKISMVWVPIASMANLGGISTAPAVTAAYNRKLMPHAIVLAILSMVTGTFWGILTTWLFNLYLSAV